ncbi:Rhodopsin, GQ-coupled [Mizuhopecten yessoensis]|uniref:Rhodopsin, GQ-coupled n=1 Tax=Mizuhopecten yessoensis TaxID=6573 RepID=A0A210PZ91_MIZYE|nr:Rhodopsin, GQ-coupled [Mizuhopecten yessoensis]
MNVTSENDDNSTRFSSLHLEESEYFADNFVPVTVFLVIIFVVGGFGNGLTFFLYFTKFSRSNHRVLVLWLSMADFLSSVGGIPFVLCDLYYTLTFTNEALCKIGKLLSVFFPSFSLGLLTFIAVVRYWKVCMPFRGGLTTKRSHIVCATVGAFEFLLLAVPALWIYGIKERERPGYETGHDCTIAEEYETATVTTFQRMLNVVLLTISFSVCLVIYILIGRALIKRSKICVVDTPTRTDNGAGQKQKANTLCKHGNVSTIGRHTKVNTLAKSGMGQPTISDVFGGKRKLQEESSSRYPNSDSEYQNRNDIDSMVSDECIPDRIRGHPPLQEDEMRYCNCDCVYNSEDEDENMPSSDEDSIKLVHHKTDQIHNTGSCESATCRVENCEIKTNVENQTQQTGKEIERMDIPTNKTAENPTKDQEAKSIIRGPTQEHKPDEKNETCVPKDNDKPAAEDRPAGKADDNLNRVFSFRVSPAVNRGLERSRRLSIIFIVVTALSFGTCLPFLVFSTIKLFNAPFAAKIAEHANVSSFLTYVYFFNSALNPIVYGFMDAKFRREIRLCCKRIKKRVLRFCKRKKPSKYYV